MTGRFDARAQWAAMSAEEQARFGALALVSLVAGYAGGPGTRWDHAAAEAEAQLRELMPDPADYPAGPDLAALGIRACRECGCTDRSACDEGCCWVLEDLCSACAPGRAS
jgi:hypothetical protein